MVVSARGLLLLQEIGVGNSGQCGGFVHDGGVMNLFVHSDSVVHRSGLDRLPLDDGLDCYGQLCNFSSDAC